MGIIKFGIFADLHLDIMHDGEMRLNEFLDSARKEKPDFVFSLGDFCYPLGCRCTKCRDGKLPINLKNSMEHEGDIEKNLELLRQYNEFEIPSYHAFGNHEFDFAHKDALLALFKMPYRYYSFEVNGWKFIVLDPNNYKDENGMIHPYEYGNYFGYDLPYIDSEQLEWFGKEVSGSSLPIVVFSHQSILGFGNHDIRNNSDLLDIIDASGGRVKMCINGHMHEDRFTKRNDVVYFSLNSISNFWMGEEYEAIRYDDKTEMEFPNLRYVAPYEKPLYTFITLDDDGYSIEPKKSSFRKPSPSDMHYPEELSAEIPERTGSFRS